MKKTLSTFAAALLLSPLPGRCRAEAIKVFAAASLTEAFREVASLYEREHPGDRVELNFAGSQLLKRQIEEGAPADVFASADQVHMDGLLRQGLAAEARLFARNRLVVAVPPKGRVRGLEDLARPGVKVVLAASGVPAGRYAGQVLDKMDAPFRESVRANVVSLETSVRSVLMKVVLGEADAGFVYATDAVSAPGRVRVIPIPDSFNVVAAYPIAPLSAGASPEKARAFTALVLSERGRAALEKRGFLPPP